MIFNQFEFLFLFLPLVLVGFFLPGLERLRPLLLLAASLLFYGLSGAEHAVVLMVGVVWVYVVTRSEAAVGSRFRLVLAIVPPLTALLYYKYMGFLVGQVLDLKAAENRETFDLFSNIVLPAGISFFTFQLVSFAIDRFRGHVHHVPSPTQFALYIGFFPQLVAGPILRFGNVAQPLASLAQFRLSRHDVSRAIAYVCLGLAAKVLLADSLSHAVTPLAAAPGELSPVAALYVVFAYSFQIYFDFYGYSLIAIGLGAFFGFRFPQNFAHPYGAANPREFWRRWHITLSYWIRDYLYVPLGGNRHYVRNIVIVFAVCGLWHGAGWTFLAWGLFHGLLVGLYHLGSGAWRRMPRRLQQGLTFVLVSFAWTLFLFDFGEVLALGRSLVGLGSVSQPNPGIEMWLELLVAAAVCFGVRFEALAESESESLLGGLLRTAGAALLFVVTLFFLDQSETFIYFRF